MKNDKPQEGKVYALTGASKSKCIANGNTWIESEVPKQRINVAGTPNAFKKLFDSLIV